MSGWSLFFKVIGIVELLAAAFLFLLMQINACIALIFAALSTLFLSSICKHITMTLDNQKEIISQLKWGNDILASGKKTDDTHVEREDVGETYSRYNVSGE